MTKNCLQNCEIKEISIKLLDGMLKKHSLNTFFKTFNLKKMFKTWLQ